MPRPNDPISLVCSPGGLFPDQHVAWKEELRTYRYFRVFGYNEFRLSAGLANLSDIENNTLVDEARKIVQTQWESKGYLPPSSPNKDSLDLARKGQIENVRRRKLVSFQTACLAIVALELAIAKSGKTKPDIYEASADDPNRIAICPVLFQPESFTNEFLQDLRKNLTAWDDLKRKTFQFRTNRKGEGVFHDIVNGQLVTEILATKIANLHADKLGGCSIPMLRDGVDFRKPSELENETFPV